MYVIGLMNERIDGDLLTGNEYDQGGVGDS